MVTVITGLICAGKSTLVKQLTSWGYNPVLEYTTRPIRENEHDNVDYHFIDDATFDSMEAAGEFAEILHVNTVFGKWKYGAKKDDLTDNTLLMCGLSQVIQLMESGVPMISVLLDIDKDMVLDRAKSRGDNLDEVNRRFSKDVNDVAKIRDHMDIVLDANASVEENAKAVDRIHAQKTGYGYMREINGCAVVTAQELSNSELKLYLESDHGIQPYLRLKNKGMPVNPLNQIAWLLLSGGGCAFCKVCREKPCNIKDGETCTKNIANYIRDCVHAEDVMNKK